MLGGRKMNNISVRYAKRDELERINEMRSDVNELHVNGCPDIFRPGFCTELQQHIYEIFDSDKADVIVAKCGETLCGFAIVEYIDRPESAYNKARSFYHIEEFGVDAAFRRMGVASAIVEFCKIEAKAKGYNRVELDVWEFNDGAIKFYEAAGFQTYRRLMQLDL